MKKIIGVIHPFDAKQILYVYQNGNKLAFEKVNLNEIPEMIFKFAKQYDVKQVNLAGSKVFNQRFVKKIQQLEMTKFNKNELEIKCI